LSLRADAARLALPAFVPEGWPVIEPDLLMGYVGDVLSVRIGGNLTAHGFARYIEEWSRSVDARPPTAKVFAMYDLPEWPGMNAVQRKQWAGMLKSREGVLRATTRSVVIASPSVLTRGSARAIFWLAPPPYPYAIVDSPHAAFEAIAKSGGPPAEEARVAYTALVRAHFRAAPRR
jgi:hypothetical protein